MNGYEAAEFTEFSRTLFFAVSGLILLLQLMFTLSFRKDPTEDGSGEGTPESPCTYLPFSAAIGFISLFVPISFVGWLFPNFSWPEELFGTAGAVWFLSERAFQWAVHQKHPRIIFKPQLHHPKNSHSLANGEA